MGCYYDDESQPIYYHKTYLTILAGSLGIRYSCMLQRDIVDCNFRVAPVLETTTLSTYVKDKCQLHSLSSKRSIGAVAL